MKKNDFVSFRDVTLEDGFWKDRYDLNKNVSISSVRDRFEETFRFDAMRFNYLKKGNRIHFFYDSDVAKWIEGVAYLIEHDREASAEHEALIDEIVDCMAAAQREDGYLNSYHQQLAPHEIFKIRDHHELYCCGHMIEAAIAYDQATGKRKLLDVMERYCDCIERAFITEKTAAFNTPGHEEIELALFKLYRYTKNEKYKRMAEFFLTNRGTEQDHETFEPANWKLEKEYAQDNADIYHLEEAFGHSVRALYLYSGIADMALENNDKALKESLDRVWNDIVNRKLYITGGVGSTRVGEMFTVPYDLPNHTAYAESCCAIAFIMFAMRMRRIEQSAKYGHLIEHIMYNNLLSSTSLSGKAFFYENPLEIPMEDYGRLHSYPFSQKHERLAIRERVEVFNCSCCPPNINRFFAEIGDLICFDSDHAMIEQYMSGTVNSAFGQIKIAEAYATKGTASVSCKDYKADKISLRMPTWTNNYTVKLNGSPVTEKPVDGYLTLAVPAAFEIELCFEIKPRFIAANPKVRADVGRMALCYGPLVYCLEGVDNGERLNQISVSPAAAKNATLIKDFHPFLSIEMEGLRDAADDRLYFPVEECAVTPVKLKFIPSFAFANRGESDMLIWVRKA